MAKRKMAKPTIMKAHRIARKVAKSKGRKPTARDYKIGMSVAKKAARKRKRR